MKFKSIYLVAGALIVMGTASCKKDLLKANISPTGVSAANYNPNFSLSEVQMMYTGSTDFAGEVWQTEWGGIAGYIQHVASTNTSFYYGDKYLLSTANVGKYFEEAYSQQVEPVVDLLQLTANKPQYKNLHQIARIMRALVFQRITDMYGDVPYSQAGLGYYERIYTPVYDKQQDIYADMLKEVSQAVDSLDDNADKPTGDLYYYTKGTQQIAEWRKFGNSLLLRLAMRLTKVDQATAQAWVLKVVGKTITSNDDNAIVQHVTGQLTQNRDAWTIDLQDSTDLKLSDTLIGNMKRFKDPRLSVIAWIWVTRDNKPEDQQGLPPGYIQSGLDSSVIISARKDYPKVLGMQGYSRLSDIVIGYESPSLIMTCAESELLLADATKRWGISTGATDEAHYNTGVTAALTQFSAYANGTITPAQATAYLSVPGITYNPSDGLEQINTQYWLCTLLDEYEAWANWRRTSAGAATSGKISGYPALKPTNFKANITNGTIPRRLQYPSSQAFSNSANYQKAVSNLPGGDGQTQRVWWDVLGNNN